MSRFYVLLLFLVLASCGEKVIEAPNDLIEKGKMADILYDLALINAAKSTNPGILEEGGIEPMEFLYKKYGVDSVQFVKSDIYYASIPLEYEAIYETVATRLEKNKKDSEDARKRKNDSIQKLSEENNIKKNTGLIRKTAQDTLP
jgi:hypothetical protein